jgi:light-regulated signal transduction histidine kinase (bacteriophytochrome)
VTALSKDQKYVFQGYQSGAVDYLCKPLDDEILKSKVKVFTDLYLQRKTIEEQISKLENANKALDAFAHTVSHDLGSPLKSVIRYAQMFKSMHQGTLDASSMKPIDTVIDNALMMHKMMQSILDFSRIGKEGLSKEDVDMKSVVMETISSLKSDIEEKKADVKIVGNFPVFSCYKVQVVQVLINLINNGLKYIAQDKPPEITIGCSEEDQFHWYFVKDNGIGIRPEYYAKIFEVFGRLHGKKSPYRGTGVGLSSVKKAIECHEGEIYLESREGEGTTFHFSLQGARERKLGKILLKKKIITEDQF